MKQKKYAYYLIPKNLVNKQKYLVYFLECKGSRKRGGGVRVVP